MLWRTAWAIARRPSWYGCSCSCSGMCGQRSDRCRHLASSMEFWTTFSSCKVDIDRVVCIDRNRLVLGLSLLSQANMRVVFTMTILYSMTWLMALCAIFLLLKVVELTALRRRGRSVRETMSPRLRPLRQTSSTCRFCHDYLLLSVKESINFHIWGRELRDYDISPSNTSLLHYKFTLRMLGG